MGDLKTHKTGAHNTPPMGGDTKSRVTLLWLVAIAFACLQPCGCVVESPDPLTGVSLTALEQWLQTALSSSVSVGQQQQLGVVHLNGDSSASSSSLPYFMQSNSAAASGFGTRPTTATATSASYNNNNNFLSGGMLQPQMMLPQSGSGGADNGGIIQRQAVTPQQQQQLMQFLSAFSTMAQPSPPQQQRHQNQQQQQQQLQQALMQSLSSPSPLTSTMAPPSLLQSLFKLHPDASTNNFAANVPQQQLAQLSGSRFTPPDIANMEASRRADMQAVADDLSPTGVPFSGSVIVDDMGPMKKQDLMEGMFKLPGIPGCGCDPNDYSDAFPSPRYGHVVVIRENPKCRNMVIYGGMDDDDSLLFDVWEYDFASKVWCEHKAKGKSDPKKSTAKQFNPGPRANHTGVMLDNNLVVFGGHNGLKTLNDVWEFDLARDEWTERKMYKGFKIGDRENAMGWNYQGDLWVFGGISSFLGPTGDMWTWTNQLNMWKQKEITTSSDPGARYGSAVHFMELIYVFGGKFSVKYFNDLWTWDPLAEEWKELLPFDQEKVPMGRVFTAGALVGDFYIYGGFGYDGNSRRDLWAFDVNLHTWTEMKTSGSKPPDVYLHVGFVHDTEFCIHGGKGSEGVSPGIFCYNPVENKWRQEFSG
eukprot:c9426_g1_i1.p1 GENE.c9426_g1_i1~~c9426_g1_i1.p1  ORF type:complete len:644 (+),score=191.75 c9426_g1_i1:1-1932(+)